MAGSFLSRTGDSPEEGIKAPVVATASVNITLSGVQVVNSYQTVAGDRVLVKGQTDSTLNGIYNVSNSLWTRATDFNASNDVVNGVLVLSVDTGDIHQAVFTGAWSPDVTQITFSLVITVTPVGDGQFVPLVGTGAGDPITGTLLWDSVGAGSLWSQLQGDLFGINAMIFNGTGVDSEFFITTIDSLGNGNQFRFTKDGEFYIPSQLAGNNEAWVIKGVDFLGTENALSIFSFDNNTNLRTSNPIILYSSATEFFYHGEDGKILTSGVIQPADNNQVLVTKLYVDSVVAGIGGLPSDSAGNLLVGTGAGWAAATGASLDVTTVPGQANFIIGGAITLANTHANHLLESWATATDEVYGVNWLKLIPSSTAGAFSIYTDSAMTENFGFSGGFLSLPKLPTSDTHAASKKYVDDRLPAGGSLNDTLRWNGSDWLANANLQINAAGEVAMSQALEVTGITTLTGAVVLSSGMHMTLTTGAGGNNNEFLSIDGSGFLLKSGYNPSSFATTADVVLKTGVQSIAGHKTFSDTNTTIQNLDVVTNVAIATHLGVDKVLYSNNLGILVEASFSPADVVLNTRNLTAGDGISGGGTLSANRTFDVDSTVLRTTGAQSIAGHKTFTDTNTTVQNLDVVTNVAIATHLGVDKVLYSNNLGILVEASFSPADVVLNTRNLTAGDGLSGGGTLSANRTFDVDSTVLRTTGTQQISGVKEFNSGITAGNSLTQPGGNTDIVVGGTIALEGMTSAAGTDIVHGYGVLALKSSDESLKENVSPTRYGLEDVLLLSPSDFNWIETGETDTGFIAQAVQKVIPEATPQNPDGLLGFRDGPILAALTMAIQEQQVIIDGLMARLEAAGI